jgi:hypothetical protein
MLITIHVHFITLLQAAPESINLITQVDTHDATYDCPTLATVPTKPGTPAELVLSDHHLFVVINTLYHQLSFTHFRQDLKPLHSRHATLPVGFSHDTFLSDPAEDLPYLSPLTFKFSTLVPHYSIPFSFA